MRRFALPLASLILLAACQAPPTLTPFAALQPSPALQVIQMSTPLPTHTPRPLFASLTPSPTASSAPTQASAIVIANATSVPIDPHAQGAHFVFDWPIRGRGPYTLLRNYAYGGTGGGTLQVHHGVDLVNPLGTPIHAAADGTVIYAGDDLTLLFGPYTNYYGNLVVIQHNFLSPEGLPVFTLYGHMQGFAVRAGQQVHSGDVIGTVGETGIARGPHVHFEVRIGNAFSFATSRNPELWLRPLDNTGLLTGRVTDASGNPVYNLEVSVQSRSQAQQAYTYGDNTVNSDPALGENFTLGNLAPGVYTVLAVEDQRIRFQSSITIVSNQLTWIDVQLSP